MTSFRKMVGAGPGFGKTILDPVDRINKTIGYPTSTYSYKGSPTPSLSCEHSSFRQLFRFPLFLFATVLQLTRKNFTSLCWMTNKKEHFLRFQDDASMEDAGLTRSWKSSLQTGNLPSYFLHVNSLIEWMNEWINEWIIHVRLLLRIRNEIFRIRIRPLKIFLKYPYRS